MRFTVNLCNKRGCVNLTRAGFRFCYAKDCGGNATKGEEE